MGSFFYFKNSAIKYIQVLVSLLACFYLSVAYSASFDCSKAVHKVEKLICETPELSSLDVQMAQLYQKVLVADDKRKKLRDGQRSWLRLRNECDQKFCLENLYHQRIRYLSSIYLEGYKDIDNAANEEGVKSISGIQIIKPNSNGDWKFNNYIFSIDYECRIIKNIIKSEKSCFPPLVSIRYERDRGNVLFSGDYFLKAGDVFVGNQSLVGLSNKSIFSADFRGKGSRELFEYLLSNPSAHLDFFYEEIANTDKTGMGYYFPGKKIIEKKIFLSDFEKTAKDIIYFADEQYDKRVEKRTKENIFAIAVAFSSVAILLLLAIFLLRKVKSGLTIAKSKLKVVKESVENKKVARVAKEEAVREVVRNSIRKVDDSSLEALREQIKVALESGDTKLAGELINVLNQLEKKEK